MSNKLTQNLTEATAVDKTADRVPIYSAASSSELRYMTPDNLVPDASTTVEGKVELATSAETITGTDTVRAVTPAGAAAAYQPLDTDLTAFATHPTYITTLNINPLFAPQGFLINGKISVTVASNNLTVAIKTLADTDPSTTDPIYVRIGDTVRSITAALSVTKNAGTNWCNAGSSELATKEIDYFAYLGYNATDGVVIGFSRFPGANQYSDFSTTTTNEKYCAISTITTAASTDYYEVIGRFAATLSAGAGYTWSVPTFTAINLIQRPIYETRWLTYVPTITGVTSQTGTFHYLLSGNTCVLQTSENAGGTSNATTKTLPLPFSALAFGATDRSYGGIIVQDATAWQTLSGHARIESGALTTLKIGKTVHIVNWTASGTCSFAFQINYEI